MRAVVIQHHGDSDAITLRDDLPDLPPPGGDQVLVRVRAAGLNRADIMQRQGNYPAPPGAPRDIPGLEFAGEVAAIGPAVLRWQPGARVMGITGGGAQADFVLVPEGLLAEVPDSLDWVEAAALPEAFITAHDALFTQMRLRMGETVLIHAAASGVGTAAVQLAHTAGCLVFGTSRTAEKLDRVRPLGLDEAIVVPRADPASFAAQILDATAGIGVNVILDLVGGPYLGPNLKALAPRGRMICVGLTAGASATLDLGTLLTKRASITGTMLRGRSVAEKTAAVQAFAQHVLPLVRCGMLRPVIDSQFKVQEIARAHARLESDATYGKVILTF